MNIAKYPPEILYIIIGHVAAEFLDELIIGPHSLRKIKRDTIEDPERYISNEDELHNPLITFLTVSYQFRITTIRVLSHALGILRDEGGRLTCKPWTRIAALRRLFTEPVMGDTPHATTKESEPISMSWSPLAACYTAIATDAFNLSFFLTPHMLQVVKETTEITPTKPAGFITMIGAIRQEFFRERIAKRVSRLLYERFTLWASMFGTSTHMDEIQQLDAQTESLESDYEKALVELRKTLHIRCAWQNSVARDLHKVIRTIGPYDATEYLEELDPRMNELIERQRKGLETLSTYTSPRLSDAHFTEAKAWARSLLSRWPYTPLPESDDSTPCKSIESGRCKVHVGGFHFCHEDPSLNGGKAGGESYDSGRRAGDPEGIVGDGMIECGCTLDIWDGVVLIKGAITT